MYRPEEDTSNAENGDAGEWKNMKVVFGRNLFEEAKEEERR